jgi:hypothetical protein
MTGGKFSRNHTRSAKLTATQVLDIRTKFADGATQGSLAREYGVTVGTIGRITRGETWNQFAFVESEGQVDARLASERIRFGPRPPPTPEELLASQQRLLGMLGQPPIEETSSAVLDKLQHDIGEAKAGQVDAVSKDGKTALDIKTLENELEEFTKGDSR